MKANVYIKIEESPSSGYISINDIVLQNDIKDEYEYSKERSKHFGFTNKIESFEGFKLKYILVNVKFDGRKGIKEEDILQSLNDQNLVIKKGESMFGGFYSATDELKEIITDQLKKRKQLVNNGQYEVIA